jgi:hypothetical protein
LRCDAQIAPQVALAASTLSSQQPALLSQQEVLMNPSHINPVQWDQAVGLARQSCARIYRDGGSPADALQAFGHGAGAAPADWDRAIRCIAQGFCQTVR